MNRNDQDWCPKCEQPRAILEVDVVHHDDQPIFKVVYLECGHTITIL